MSITGSMKKLKELMDKYPNKTVLEVITNEKEKNNEKYRVQKQSIHRSTSVRRF